jgi:hypothetical protein
MRRIALVALLALLVVTPGRTRGEGIEDAWAGVSWGESTIAVARHLGAKARALPQPIDFGDSYAPLVMRGFPVGGVPLIVYYQMDKTTNGLKRIQLERPRHGVTSAAFRGVLRGLEAGYGLPDLMCGARPAPASGYQAAVERIWVRDGRVIRAIFRDTTLEALYGCVVPGSCGLTAQLLLRVSSPRLDKAACQPPARPLPGQAPAPPGG